MNDDGVEALEGAVRHHLDELTPAARARIASLTLFRRAVPVVVGVAWIELLLAVDRGPREPMAIFGVFALGMAATIGVLVANRAARRAIARSALRSIEAAALTSSLGKLGGSTTASAGSFVLPALSGTPSNALSMLPAKSKKKSGPSPSSLVDRDAPDFDDAD